MASNPLSSRPDSADKDWDRHRVRPERDSRLSTAPGQVRQTEAMDVDDPQGTLFIPERKVEPRISSRPPSWHSEDVYGQNTTDSRPSPTPKSVSFSDTRSTSPTTSTSDKKSENAHDAAYRLFKLSIKQASEKYGPFLPPDDGSPFLAHRLHRLWDDLSKEQQLEYYARAATEINSESVEVSQKSSRPYSPQLRSASSGYASPTFGAGSAARTRFSPYEIPEHHHMSTHTPEMRSPVFSNDDDPSCGSVRSRSQSPAGEDGQPHSSHVPRPPNAWILFRSTMSKLRRPDGVVYSPPEISVMWKNLDATQREVWFEKAKEAKQQHEAANPGYKYRPNRTKSQGARRSTDTHGGGSGSSSRGHRTHPAPSPPPWHTRF